MLDSGVLYPEKYHSPSQRREIPGLSVAPTKRPGTETQT
jgi:hypothetical protein